MNSITVKAYGKLNLSLFITDKLADGFHSLDSVMQSIDLFNEIEIREDLKFSFSSNDINLPTDISNTAIKASRVFFDSISKDPNVSIFLKKNIPYQAGMGSASADAAGVLKGLNQLYGLPLSEEELFELSKKCGSDVPFCLVGGTKRVKGKGELISSISPIEDLFFLIVKPSFGVSTKEAYANWDNKKIKNINTNDNFIKDYENIGKYLINDLIPNDERIHNIINKLKNFNSLGASMTGSGSACFSVYKNEADAKASASLFNDCLTYITKPVPFGISLSHFQ